MKKLCIVFSLVMVFSLAMIDAGITCSPGGGSGNGDSGGGGDSGSGGSDGGDSGDSGDGDSGDSGDGDSGDSGDSGGSSGGSSGTGSVGASTSGDGADWAYRVGNDFDEPGKDFADSLVEHEPDWILFRWLGISDRCNNETGENCDWTLYKKEKKFQPDRKE